MPSDTNMLPATPHSKEALSSDQQLVLKGMALDMVANAVLITDIDGTILWVNPAFTHLTGYAPEEVIGQTPRLLKSGMHSSQFYKKLWETILVGKTWRGSFTNRRKDGTPYYDEHTITPIRSDDGMRITHFVAIMNDVTMRRQAEAAWRKSEGRFRLLGEQAMDAFFLHDDHGKLLDVNRRACESLGYSKEELLNMSVSDVSCLSEEEVRNVWVQLQTASTITVNDYHRRKDGTQFPVEIRVGSVEIEGEKLFLGLARDITERKQAEQALTESQSRYRSLFENMLGGYAYCRMLFEQGHAHDFIYLEVNSAFEALTGLKNVVGKKVSEVIPKIQETNPELFEIYGRVALTGNPEKYETYLEPLGKWFSISVYSH